MNLDWNAIERIFREKHNLGIRDDVEYKQGDIVVHGNEVAYKLDFEVKIPLSVLFNRRGDYLALATPSDPDASDGPDTERGSSKPESETDDKEEHPGDTIPGRNQSN